MLHGTKIDLRLMRERDLDTFVELESDVLSRGDYVPLHVWTETRAKERFKTDGFWSEDNGFLLIVSKDDGRILGQVVFFKSSRYFEALELGYTVYPQSRGKGVATEAVNLLVDFLFRSRNFPRLQVLVELPNVASRRVAIKTGFTSEGIIRHAIITRGEPRDLECLSILRAEHAERQKPLS